jgi:circadian clock protein KaiC
LYTVDCAVILKHCVEHGISRRSVRVQKYRGRAFNEDEAPLLIGRSGMEVAVTRTVSRADVTVSNERVSSGIGQLDTMLAGGFFRGSTTLITGASGTAKTTLGGAFAQAACQRGERTLFVSFDSDCSEVVRNLASVGILLTPHLDEGSLRMISARTIAGSAETYLMRIRNLAEAHQARCLVIDPIYLDSKTAGDLMAQRVADQLIDWSKSSGRTLLCTRLLDENSNIKDGGSPLQISMIVDTWLHLNYLVQGNERVRTLSIIKSRGTPHSNKVRGLHLAHGGVTLDDTWSRDSGAREGTP